MKKILISAFVISSLFISLPAFSAELDLIVGDYTLVSKKRVGRTTIEYTYKLDILNNDTVLEALNVTATLSSASPKTTIIDGTVDVASIPASGNVTSTDTFSIRQDRRFPFNPASLNWTFTGIALPPDPGDEADTTVLGVDVNGNDIRDDVERKIVLKHFPHISKITLLNKQAFLWQQGLMFENIDNPNIQRDNNNELGLLIGCGFIIYGDDFDIYDLDSAEVDRWLHDTSERSSAQDRADSQIQGQEFTSPDEEEVQAYCNELLQE